MGVLPTSGPLVIASHNADKVEEFRHLLARSGLELSSAAEHEVEEAEETGRTFAENALIKARHVAGRTRLPALADDTGVCVHALSGAPGIHTARWGGPDSDFDHAMERVERELSALVLKADRRAEYVCALALVSPDGREFVCERRRAGIVIWPPRGEQGAGLEPMFLPNGYAITYGEMSTELKVRINARAEALRWLTSVTA